MSLPKPIQHSGPVAGHVGKGRVFKPPLAATGLLNIGDWTKDDLPDLLWPALVAAEQGDAGMCQFQNWQKAVQDALAHHGEADFVAESLDGRLTHLANLADRFPDATEIILEQGSRHGLLSTAVRRALASYPVRPASWLTSDTNLEAPEQSDLKLIADALLAVIRDGHREALIKCMRSWSMIQTGTFRSDPETIEALKDYPNSQGKSPATDSLIRASWGAHKATLLSNDPNYFDEAIKWARMFWGVNSVTSGCVRKQEVEVAGDTQTGSVDDESAEPNTASETARPAPMPDGGENLHQFALDVLGSFIEALETSPAHLYENERQEVVSGLVARAGRDVIAVLGTPDLWCLEHGAHIGRMLVETKIYMRWMARQDRSIYRQFQEYGAGKAKLYARIVDEFPTDARTDGFNESIEELTRLSHNHDVLDHRVVDTRDTFAEGKSIRVMAQEADLLDLYRQAYSLSSGVAHSEWWSVETHAMERCLNVLHGGHLVPSMALNPGGNVELATSWVGQFYSLVRDGLQILGTDEAAVSAAFAWMEDDEEQETVE